MVADRAPDLLEDRFAAHPLARGLGREREEPLEVDDDLQERPVDSVAEIDVVLGIRDVVARLERRIEDAVGIVVLLEVLGW